MSDRIQCIRCWHQTPIAAAFCECSACRSRGASRWMRNPVGPRRRVRDQRKNRWRQLLSDGDSWPSCPRHEEVRLKLFCEECEQPLSPLAVLEEGVKGFRLGFAGAVDSGKTVLLATMVEQFRRQAHGASEIGLLSIDGTDERFDVLASRLFAEKKKPKPTQPEMAGPTAGDGTDPRNFCWQIELGSGRRKPSPAGLLTVYDVAGETWKEPHDQGLEVFDRYLSQMTALVFLVDGAPLAEDLGLDGTDAWSPQPVHGDGGRRENHWLSRIVERLKERAHEIDVAMVVSKADLLWEHSGADVLRPGAEADPEDLARRIEDLLAESGRRGLVTSARAAFRKVKLFAASSLGFKPTRLEVAGGRLQIDLQPVGVVEPLRWLLGQQVRRFRD